MGFKRPQVRFLSLRLFNTGGSSAGFFIYKSEKGSGVDPEPFSSIHMQLRNLSLAHEPDRVQLDPGAHRRGNDDAL